MKLINSLFILYLFIAIAGCRKKGCTDEKATNYDSKAKKSDESCIYPNPQVVFKMEFDSTQERLDNFGNPAQVPSGHGAQHPKFNLMGIHYMELSKANDIPAYNGTMLYDSPTTTLGGSKAIDFDKAIYIKNGQEFFTMNLSDLETGSYKYIRISLSYQNYDIDFRANGLDLTGTVASFVGANTYIRSFTIKNESLTINDNKLQGYWAFETDYPGVPVSQGQAPGTTVPNPIAATSAIPPGSCLVTGVFDSPLVITGDETEDITINVKVSINNSFEWKDDANNNIYEPLDGDTVVDMGVRGIIPEIL